MGRLPGRRQPAGQALAIDDERAVTTCNMGIT
ncbi:hypothetical protein HNQ81_002192 [Desulfoprunum benzoelyticum]|uniref:Uncharacterized protein n=1 Tax=Desulfoprunum benzoelyticum TaxID=1506996 RepID=A0A840UUE1_9BACT|nr:hypothetical protein [Desulfoprunum benzoelyticum]